MITPPPQDIAPAAPNLTAAPGYQASLEHKQRVRALAELTIAIVDADGMDELIKAQDFARQELRRRRSKSLMAAGWIV